MNIEIFNFIPFIGLLLSMAILPQLIPHAWEKHMGKISIAWVFLSASLSLVQSKNLSLYTHALTQEYIPFITLIFALYSISSGMHLNLKLQNSAIVNTLYLFFGGILAGFIGTTGASLLLIRPFLNLNAHRKYKTHLAVFFIFIISNIGGAFSTLGDPPLFVGYLNGVHFFWPTFNLSIPTLVIMSGLLIIFFIIDQYLFSKDTPEKNLGAFSFEGKRNIFLLLAVIILSCFPIPSLLRSLAFAFLGGVSFYITSLSKRHKWGFHMDPFLEIFKLFFGIFCTIAPIIELLKMGENGPLKTFFQFLNISPSMPSSDFFWITGFLSALLDNAPTYLVFFHIAGGNAQELMSSNTLIAISLGAVFMGALTYIGNAPNLMVRNIANHKGAKMPHFFGYMLWSCCILIPLFFLTQRLFLK